MLFAILFGGFLVLATAAAAYHHAIGRLDQSYHVLRTVERLLTSLAEAETGQRSYLLMQEDRFLAPYTGSTARIPALLDEADALTADAPAQREHIRSLRSLIQARLTIMATTLEQARAHSFERALATVRDGAGERLMAQIRERIAAMTAEEDSLLAVRTNRADLLASVMAIFGIAFVAAAVASVRSALRRLQRDFDAERAEGESLAQALQRNTVLLGEVNHRVKNSLQVVSNLLRTQALKHPDATVREQLLDGSSRVDAIAEVHRRLYGTDCYDTVELIDLIRSIAENAVPLTATAEHAVILTMPDPIPLPVREAIPVVLIVNELLTNVYKHAFPDGRTGTITVSVERTADELRVGVADDGVGLPDGAESRQTTSFGLGMVRILTGQLKGTLDIRRTTPGTRFTVRFSCRATEQADIGTGVATQEDA